MDTNECTKELQYIKHFANGIIIMESNNQKTIYNDNKACIQCSDSVTSKGIKHLNIIEEWFYNVINQGVLTWNTSEK